MIIQHSTNCILEFDVKHIDESFDHEFGTKKDSTIKIENFKVTVYVDLIDYNLTPGLTPDELGFFKESARKKVLETYGQRIGDIS